MRSLREPRWRGLIAGAALLGLTMVGCLAGCGGPGAASLPDGVTVSVLQNRFDYSQRVLELEIDNTTDTALTVTSASFVSTRFATPAVWTREQEIPDGAARDLPVKLGQPVCGNTPPKDSVLIAFTLADGSNGTATVTPADEQGRVDAINAEDCLGASVAAIAAITVPAHPQWTPGAHAPAELDISVVPTGGAGALTIHGAKGTVLLGLVDGGTGQPHDLTLDLLVDAKTGTRVIPLQLAPARCDAHAIEEDKRGTFFPLDVETNDGRSGTIYVPVSDSVRQSLYEFYADYCSLP